MFRVQLNRELIIETAISLLDSYGLGDTTMRRVATSLSVAPGALYWHVANKQSLIAAMADHIIADIFASPADTSVTNLALTLRMLVQAHRDGAEVTMAGLSQPGSPTWPALVERFAHALAASASENALNDAVFDNFEESRAPQLDSRFAIAATAIIHLTLGAATMEQSSQQLADVAGGQAATDHGGQTAADQGGQTPTDQGAAALEAGVEIIARGLHG